MRSQSNPFFVASYRIGDFPNAGLKCLPWKRADCDSVLINAYDFIENHRTLRIARQLLQQRKPISELLECSVPMVLDSGAYYFVRSASTTICPEKIAELAVKLEIPSVVTLDHPFPPNTSAITVSSRISATLANTVTMSNWLRSQRELGLSTPEMWPVLHGHDERTLIDCHTRMLGIMPKPVVVGLGSLAPLAQTGSLRKIAQVVRIARDLLEDSHMHVFSVGSPLLMHFAFLCGADSVDSQSWMMSAAFKQAQLPGLPQLRLSYREQERDAEKYRRAKARFADALLRLCGDEGLKVKDWSSGDEVSIKDVQAAATYVESLEDQPGVNRVHSRACHNLHIATFEARKYGEKRRHGQLGEHLTARHVATPYWRVLAELLEKGSF